ncbi:glycosyltransferase [Devosia sp. Root413D1]|uniref:glycosyltransferase n=1 Tax=Devosia sp. Root413D1 TaxID=1736531 RepID=UPI00138F8233|nr:glycosyltransferase [Devosia sp. Root413D1]
MQKVGFENVRHLSLLAYLSIIRKHDLVHIHTSNRYVRLAHTLASRLMGRCVVQTFHGRQGHALERLMLRLSRLMGHASIGVSHDVAEVLQGNVSVIPAFVPPRVEDEALPIAVASWLRNVHQSGRGIIAMNAARAFRPHGIDLYGIDMLLTSFLNTSINEKYCAIICVGSRDGADGYLDWLLEQARPLILQDRVKIVFDLPNFAGVLKEADIFVRPTSWDGDAISIREALWYGLPVVASDAVQRPDAVSLFRNRNQTDLEQAILSVGPRSGHLNAGAPDYVLDVLEVYRTAMSRFAGKLRLADPGTERS